MWNFNYLNYNNCRAINILKRLTVPSGVIIEHGEDMFKVLGKITDRDYSKKDLGMIVKYFGGDKVIKVKEAVFNKLLICSKIEEAQIEED